MITAEDIAGHFEISLRTVYHETAALSEGGFKGPPSAEGIVEIAYGVNPDQQCGGHATEAAGAMAESASPAVWSASSGHELFPRETPRRVSWSSAASVTRAS